MDMFLYLDKNTIVHRLDPRTKVILLFCSFVMALMFTNPYILSAIAAIIVIYGVMGKSLANLKRIRMILIMIFLLSLVLWSLSYKGGSTQLLGPITLEGILFGVATGIKFDAMIISGMVFLSSTKMEEISLGLVKMKVPYRGAFAFSTALRLVPMIVSTSYTIIQAQSSRGLDLKSGNIFSRIKKYIPLVIPTILSVIRNTNVFAMALESKGFGYSEERSNYLNIYLKKNDYVFLSLGVLLTIGCIFIRVVGIVN